MFEIYIVLITIEDPVSKTKRTFTESGSTFYKAIGYAVVGYSIDKEQIVSVEVHEMVSGKRYSLRKEKLQELLK